nr:MAG TPA: hypothetical protein [Caudoviricetes sp.]DAV53366.1 MAG TPA: hypothetical protein [Caudoviricetes sp.]
MVTDRYRTVIFLCVRKISVYFLSLYQVQTWTSKFVPPVQKTEKPNGYFLTILESRIK